MIFFSIYESEINFLLMVNGDNNSISTINYDLCVCMVYSYVNIIYLRNFTFTINRYSLNCLQ